MTTVAAGSTGTYTFTEARTVSVFLDSAERALLIVTRSGRQVYSDNLHTSQTVGPWAKDDVLTITAIGGAVDYIVNASSASSTLSVGLRGPRLVDQFGNRIVPYQPHGGSLRRTSAEHSIWWPLASQQHRGQNTFYDYTGTLRAKFAGGSTGRWGPEPGPLFNGSNHRLECNDSDSNAPQFSSFRGYPIEGFTQAVKACADWSSLSSRGDMILAWAVISHPAAGLAADGVIASFGMNNDPQSFGGWGFGIKAGTQGKARVWHIGRNATVMDTQDMSMSGVTGQNNDNTRTALAFEIVAGSNGYIDVSSYMATLGADGGAPQSNVGMGSFNSLANSGTAACGTGINSPMMIGSMADTTPFTKLTPAGTINTGASGNVTFSADFGAAGPSATTLPYNTGIWIWFGTQATTPAINKKYYWVVMNDLRTGTIYSNGPGSAAINFSAGGAISVPTANRVNHFAGGIVQVGVERRAYDQGLGMLVCQSLRGSILDYPTCLEA